jgi:hypothetical protein
VLQARLPSAHSIVLSESTPRRATATLPDSLKRMAQACPGSMRVWVSVLRSDKEDLYPAARYRAPLVSLDETPPGTWERIGSKWTRLSIIIPPKVWLGPVGEFAQIDYQRDRYMSMRYASCVLLILAMERFYFAEQHETFSCPHPACPVRFEAGGEWAWHAVETGHYMQAKPPLRYEEDFAQRDCRLQRMRDKDVYDVVKKIRNEYGKLDDRQQRAMQRKFLHQLEKDSSYACRKPAQECSLWYRYLDTIGSRCLI